MPIDATRSKLELDVSRRTCRKPHLQHALSNSKSSPRIRHPELPLCSPFTGWCEKCCLLKLRLRTQQGRRSPLCTCDSSCLHAVLELCGQLHRRIPSLAPDRGRQIALFVSSTVSERRLQTCTVIGPKAAFHVQIASETQSARRQRVETGV